MAPFIVGDLLPARAGNFVFFLGEGDSDWVGFRRTESSPFFAAGGFGFALLLVVETLGDGDFYAYLGFFPLDAIWLIK